MDSIASAVIGIVCIIIGISNWRGNISMLHSYHKKRVSEENRLPFGRAVGLGMIIVGVSLLAMAALSYLAAALHNGVYLTLGGVALGVGLALGLGISFYAMFKYNKGIF